MRLITSIALLLAIAPLPQAHAAGNAVAGRQNFATLCAGCHSVQPGQNGIGPSLAGVVGRPSGSESGYQYSSAMTDAHLTWDDASLSRFNIPHAFPVCSFADELAAAAGRDPLDYLRELIGAPRDIDLPALGVDYPNYGVPLAIYPLDTGRLRTLLDLVAAKCGWGGKLPMRQGRGIAVHRSFLTYVAAVEVIAVGADGTVTVPPVSAAICNAIFAATGTRVRSLPVDPTQLRTDGHGGAS